MPKRRRPSRPTPTSLYRKARECERVGAYAELQLKDPASARVCRNAAEFFRRRAREETELRKLRTLQEQLEKVGLLKPPGDPEKT